MIDIYFNMEKLFWIKDGDALITLWITYDNTLI